MFNTLDSKILNLHRKPDKRGLNRYALLLASGNMTEKEIRDEMLTSSKGEG